MKKKTKEQMNEQTNKQTNELKKTHVQTSHDMSFDKAILPDDEDQRRHHNSHFQKCKTPKNQMNIFDEIHSDGNQCDHCEDHLNVQIFGKSSSENCNKIT